MDLILSDIHADIQALETILDVVTHTTFKEKYGEFSRIINLGDVLERGTHPKEVLEKLQIISKTHSLESVVGNHDEAFLYKRPVSGSSIESLVAHSYLNQQDLEFFEMNKDGTYGKQEFIDKKYNLVCVHGGPLDPNKIIPNGSREESWLYQKSWQRISEEDFEFFSFAGYHYKPSSAFKEVENLFENFIILCGHQHEEAAIIQTENGPKEILSEITHNIENISKFTLEKKEIPSQNNENYIIRVGLGGPEGYYGIGMAKPHFGIIEYDPKKVILFSINPI